MNTFLEFLGDNRSKLLEQTLEHIGITFLSLLLAILIAVPAGIFISRKQKMAPSFLGVAGVLQTIPSIALLGFLLPIMGIGIKPAIFALFLYALLPILRNTYTGIMGVERSVLEAATGMGMTRTQILRRVELPLALPVIFAGIRTATVINVGIATLAAYIGAGGLGEFIFGGIALNNSTMILAGAIPAALLAIFFDQSLAFLQRLPGRRLARSAGTLGIAMLLFSTAIRIPDFFTSGLRAGFDTEFLGRADGYPAIRETYDISFNTSTLSSPLMYRAVRDGYVDLIGGYSTDGRVRAYKLRVLEDNKGAFPPYYCAPLVNAQTAKQHPEVMEALNLLAGRLPDSVMTSLNYQVDYEKKSPDEVARAFLEREGLWRPDRAQGGEKLVLASKIFTEQYILTALFSALINGYTDLDTERKNGLGGTKICFDALRTGEVDIYPEYTGTGLMVILQPEQSVIDSLGRAADPVYRYVDEAFAKKYKAEWLQPLGFNNTYALMAREEQAADRGWTTISDLKE